MMKPALISNCEKNFISDIVSKKQLRLDGRDLNEFRPIKINFGSDWGSVHVSLGETRVLAQVTCEVAQPKSTRPNEGLLFIKVELGPMAAQHFEANRSSDLSVQVNRILERALKDSRCIDLESLCIIAEEKVWNLRVDLNVLNHEGNIIDCASIAALTALAHFKRPDVTTTGDEFIIHTHAEKDPIPIVLHHYPVCISYAIFNNGATAIADPTAMEERVSEANLVFGLNSYRELCGLHFGGITLTSSELLLQCATRGAKRAKLLVEMIKDALQRDETSRSQNQLVGFTECVRMNKITSMKQDRLSIKLKRFKLNEADESNDDERMSEDDEIVTDKVQLLDDTSAVLIPDKWESESDPDDSDDGEDFQMTEVLPVVKDEAEEATERSVKKKKAKKKKKKKNNSKGVIFVESSNSEEEETVTLNTSEKDDTASSRSRIHFK
ncbi:hypothetical protein HA402_003646 [Bradysia odoriphaga]|nr:hypothetical protein HA402_003646 [Bradysia odoriphaga]